CSQPGGALPLFRDPRESRWGAIPDRGSYQRPPQEAPMIFKCLAAAGLAASLATGGAIAVQTSSATPPAATATVAPASGAPAPAASVDDHAEVDDTTTTSTTAPAPSTVNTKAPAPVPAPTVTVFPAGDAGSVTLSVSDGMVTVAAVSPNAGWTVESEHGAGHEAKVSFRNGLRRIEFKAEFEDGRLQTRVDDHTDGDSHDQPAVSTPPAAGGNAVAGDDDDNDGQAEVENEQSSDDHRGPGRDGSDDSTVGTVSNGTTATGSSTAGGTSDSGDRSGRDGSDGGGGHDGRDG